MKCLLVLLACCMAARICPAAPLQIRVATYNASLNRDAQGRLASDLSTPANAQAKRVAEILQRVRPDVVLINEFDYDAGGVSLARFHDNYLAIGQNGQAPLSYPYRYAPPSNTGITSGFDLDNLDGYVGVPGTTTVSKERYGNDCFGFGWFPGQYGFVVYSRFPIAMPAIRTFQNFLWKDMPGAALPDRSGTPTPNDWYTSAELAVVRLSSKNHCDVPIEVAPGHIVHLLATHPTPPSFDGAEDRNGRRNHDEIRLWADYIRGAGYLRDDAGIQGGLASEQRFVILGDLNADPVDGDSFQGAINQLLQYPLINSATVPTSSGGPQAAQTQGGKNATQLGDPAHDTADFGDGGTNPGNLRIDYVLPSKTGLNVVSSGVFWPVTGDPTNALIGASDHRLVYLDLAVTPILTEAVRRLAAVREGAEVVLTWGAQSGVDYRVETSVDLNAWVPAPEIAVVIDGSQLARAVDAQAGSGQKFYRVVAELMAP